MKEATAKAICDTDDSLQIHPDYSGRGMFGSTTYAVSGRGRSIVRAIFVLGTIVGRYIGENGSQTDKAIAEREAVLEDLGNLRTDWLGKQEIYY